MHKKTIFVSGATDGIGKATALELAAMGHKLLLHGRDTEKGAALVDLIRRETKNEDLSFFCADFESLHAVNEMANEVLKDNQRLDVLINNAGGFYKRRQLTKDGYEMTFSVNHLAPALLTMQLLDLLKASAPARVVHVASTAHNGVRSVDFEDLYRAGSYSGFSAYSLSKLGNILFSNALARRLAGSGVSSNALHPGVIDTKLLRMSWNMSGEPVDVGAQTSITLAVDPTVEGINGKYFRNSRESSPSALAQDEELQERFWTRTMTLLEKYLLD